MSEVLQTLQQTQCREAVEPGWDESMAALGPDVPAWLAEDYLRQACELSGLAEADVAPVLQCARRSWDEPALRQLLWHARRCLVENTNMFRDWPDVSALLGEQRGVFWLVLDLSVVPEIEQHHRQLGIPADISRDTLARLALAVQNHRDMRGGGLGVMRRQAYWIRNHLVNDLYRIGRMEYMVRPFWGAAEAYRHTSGRVLVLAGDRLKLEADGFGADLARDDQQTWQASLSEQDGVIEGHPVCPEGWAMRETVRLDGSQWRRVVTKNTPVLEMHIPPGGSMTLEACRQSMADALEFFPRYLPDKPFEAVWIQSWIFNPQLEEIMGRDSNLARYQRQLYLFPITSKGPAGLFFIFGEDTVDPATAPRDTRLRRGILEFIEAGNSFRSSGMMFFPEDIDAFGDQPYRRAWPDTLALARNSQPQSQTGES